MQSAPVASVASPQLAEYEFQQAENIVIGDCGGRAQVWGVLCMLAGFIQIVASGLNIAGIIKGNGAIFLLPAAAFNIVLGIYFMRAGADLKRVVTTQGSDVTLMMNALRNLSRALLIQIISTALFILMVLAIIALMILAMRAMKG